MLQLLKSIFLVAGYWQYIGFLILYIYFAINTYYVELRLDEVVDEDYSLKTKLFIIICCLPLFLFIYLPYYYITEVMFKTVEVENTKGEKNHE